MNLNITEQQIYLTNLKAALKAKASFRAPSGKTGVNEIAIIELKNQLNDDFNQKLNDTKNSMSQEIGVKIAEFSASVNNTITQMSNDLSENLIDAKNSINKEIDGKINAAKSEINTSVNGTINNAITQVSNDFSKNLDDATSNITAAVDDKINTAKSEINTSVNGTINNAITQVSNDLSKKIDDTKGNITAAVDDKINGLEQSFNTSIKDLESQITFLGDSQELLINEHLEEISKKLGVNIDLKGTESPVIKDWKDIPGEPLSGNITVPEKAGFLFTRNSDDQPEFYAFYSEDLACEGTVYAKNLEAYVKLELLHNVEISGHNVDSVCIFAAA